MRFGAGRIDELADACRSLKIVRPLIITDNVIGKLPFTQKALRNLKAADLTSSIFYDAQTNPNDTHLKKAIEETRRRNRPRRRISYRSC